MHAKPTGLRPRVILIAILVGIVFESGVFFLTLLLSGAYLLATLACLALFVVVLGVGLIGSRRGGSAGRRAALEGEPTGVSIASPSEQSRQAGQR